MKRNGILLEIALGIGIVAGFLFLFAGSTLLDDSSISDEEPDFSPVSQLENASWLQQYTPTVQSIDYLAADPMLQNEMGTEFLGSKEIPFTDLESETTISIIIASFASPSAAAEAVDRAEILSNTAARQERDPPDIGSQNRYIVNPSLNQRLIVFSISSHLYIVDCISPAGNAEAVCQDIAEHVGNTVR